MCAGGLGEVLAAAETGQEWTRPSDSRLSPWRGQCGRWGYGVAGGPVFGVLGAGVLCVRGNPGAPAKEAAS